MRPEPEQTYTRIFSKAQHFKNPPPQDDDGNSDVFQTFKSRAAHPPPPAHPQDDARGLPHRRPDLSAAFAPRPDPPPSRPSRVRFQDDDGDENSDT
jgi:hypothetical protein